MYLEELQILYLSNLVRVFAVGLCLGVSTTVMTNYYILVARGKTEPAEARIMQILYRILRIGMVLAVVTEITTFMYNYHIDNFVYWTDNPELLMRLTIFSVIVTNAIAMQYHKITMWLGPVFAGGSWYAYFFYSVWVETESTYSSLFIGYLQWLVIIGVFLALLRKYLIRNHSSSFQRG